MPLLMRGKPATAHWSTDYIEHLRGVHFLLLVVCVASIIISRLPETSHLRAAKHQLDVIQHFVSDIVPGKQQEFIPKPDDVLTWLQFTFKNVKYATPLPYKIPVVDVRCPQQSYDQSVPDFMAGLAKADSLVEFRRQWNKMTCSKLRQYEDEELSSSIFRDFEASVAVGPKWKSPKLTVQLRKAISTSHQLQTTGFNILNLAAQFNLDRQYQDGSQIAARGLQIGSLVVVESRQSYDEFAILEVPLNVDRGTFLIARAAELTHGPEPILDELHLSDPYLTCSDKFERCFPDLSQVASNDGTSYTLKDLNSFLTDQISREWRPELDIYGIKIPAEDRSRWGTALVLVILFYFWLHLRELSPKLLPTDPGLDVAWIGLYPSAYASGLVWLSVFLLPLTSLVLFGLTSAHYEGGALLAFVTLHWGAVSLWLVAPLLFCFLISISCCLQIQRLVRLAAQTSSSLNDSQTTPKTVQPPTTNACTPVASTENPSSQETPLTSPSTDQAAQGAESNQTPRET